MNDFKGAPLSGGDRALGRTILLSQLGKQDEEDRIHRRGFGASPGLTGQP